MQKLVKKNLEKKLNSSSISPKISKITVSSKLKSTKLREKQSKTLKLSKRISSNKRFLLSLASGRPSHNYELKNSSKLLALTIYLASNNIFCHLKELKTNKVLSSISAGSYKFNVSKKGIRAYTKQILKLFLQDLRAKNINFDGPLVTKIISPLSLRKSVIDTLKTSVFRKLVHNKEQLFLEIPALKVFNGCRPPKKIRKKRQGLSLYK